MSDTEKAFLSLSERKALQRSSALAARNRLPAEQRALLSAQLCRHLTESRFFREAEVIMLYRAVGSEADLSPLAASAGGAGKILVYPCCTGPGTLLPLIPRGPDGWEKDRYGILSPSPSRSDPCPLERISLILCPCSAFDEEGHRLGMGGGFYDRFLPLTDGIACLVAFEAQRVSRVITEAHDLPIGLICTEAGLRSAGI